MKERSLLRRQLFGAFTATKSTKYDVAIVDAIYINALTAYITKFRDFKIHDAAFKIS